MKISLTTIINGIKSGIINNAFRLLFLLKEIEFPRLKKQDKVKYINSNADMQVTKFNPLSEPLKSPEIIAIGRKTNKVMAKYFPIRQCIRLFCSHTIFSMYPLSKSCLNVFSEIIKIVMKEAIKLAKQLLFCASLEIINIV